MNVRFDSELESIHQNNLFHYFSNQLIISDTCRKLGILTSPGRGNTCTSTFLYELGVTRVNPLKYNLPFERYLKSNYKCIDIDIPIDKKNILIDGIIKALPNDKVLYEVLYHSRHPYANKLISIEFNAIIYDVHPTAIIILEKGHKLNLPEVTVDGRKYIIIEDYDEFYKLNKYRHNLVPNTFLTQLETLVSKTGVDIDKIDVENDEVLELFRKGDTGGVFQFESPTIREVLKVAPIDNFIDLVNINTLHRQETFPLLKMYTSNKRIGYNIYFMGDPRINAILSETFGVLIYGETLIEILTSCGFEVDESYDYENVLYRDNEDHIEVFKVKFFEKCSRNTSLPNTEIDILFEFIIKWGKFMRAKGHMISYTIVSFWFAYFKTYYRNYFNSDFHIC